MTVIHIFKNGTTTKELKDVYVPKEKVVEVVAIAKCKPIREGVKK